MSKGWIRLDRAIRDNWIWKNGPFTYAQAWTDLLLGANHKAAKVSIKGTLISLEIGQQARSELTLSKEWGWSRTKVRRFLSRLEDDSMVIQQKTHLTSIITICNYKSFQGVDESGDTPEKTCNDTTEKHLKNNRKTSDDTQTNKGRSPDNENHENNGKDLKDMSPIDDLEQTDLLGDLIVYESMPVIKDINQEINDVFTYWCNVMQKQNRTALSKERKQKIRMRLEDGYSVDEIKTAVLNCSNTDHNMGRGPKSNGVKYNDIELICRNSKNLERFRDNPGSGRTAQDDDEFDNGGLSTPQNFDQPNGSTYDHDPH